MHSEKSFKTLILGGSTRAADEAEPHRKILHQRQT